MFKYFIAAAMALSWASASAHQLTVSGSDTVRLGSKVISAGDTRARVIEAGGEPDHVRTVYTDSTRTVAIDERMIFPSGLNKHTVIAIGADNKVLCVADVVGQVGAKEIAER